MKKMLLVALLGLFVTLVGVNMAFAGGDCPYSKKEYKTVVDIAAKKPQFSTLVEALQATGLDSVLAHEKEVTVFAPTNEAFEKLPPGTLENLLQNKEQLASILKYHVVAGKLPAEKVLMKESLPTLQGESLSVKQSGGAAMVNNATITKTDIKANNGYIHVIDTVLLPES